MATSRQVKSTNCFSHDSNARNDEKLVRMRMRHGAAGYGVYFMILERLREESGYMSAKDYNMIAFDLRVDSALVKSVIEEFGLFVFTEDGKYFYSDSFTRRMDQKATVNKKRSEAGKKGGAQRWKAKPEEESDKKDAPPAPKAAPIPETAPVPREQTAVSDDTCLTRFFRKENRQNIEVLLMNFGMKPDDIPKLRKLAKEVVAEWRATDKSHSDYTEWSKHLINSMRIRCYAAKGKQDTISNEQTPPASSDYKFDGGFGSKDV